MLISCDWVPTTFHGRDKQAAGIWRGARTRIKSVLQARREKERKREAQEVAKRKLKSRRISSGRQRGGGSAEGVGGAEEHSRQISDDSHERLMPIPLS